MIESVKEDVPHCLAFFVEFALTALGPLLHFADDFFHGLPEQFVDTYQICQTADMCTGRSCLVRWLEVAQRSVI